MRRTGFFIFTLILAIGLSAAPALADGAKLYKSCSGCHGSDGSKKALGVSPSLKGQSAEELEKKMLGYKDGSYGGDKKVIMTNTLKRFSPDQIKTLADHIAGF